MGLRFRKSFKIAKGIRINISKGGLSTSFGKKESQEQAYLAGQSSWEALGDLAQAALKGLIR